MKLSFFIPGIPAPGGSKKAFVIPGTNRASVVDDAKGNKEWRARVAHFVREAYKGDPLAGPLEVTFEFYFPRPKGHYGSGRNREQLKASAPAFHVVKPDTTKLIRAAEDSLKGIVWKDDNQIARQSAAKDYGLRPGCRITIWTMGGE